jgi:hypothetical protein
MNVDEVAEAICNAHCGDTEAWDITYDKGREHWRVVARAAIEALRDGQNKTLITACMSGFEQGQRR